MKRTIVSLMVLFLVLTGESFAQLEMNKHYVGPSIGISFLGSTFQIGLNYEYTLHQDNIGIIGIGGIFRYWSYSESFSDGKLNYSDVLIGAQGNYHFKINDTKYDPYAGITLAYDAGTVDWDGDDTHSTPVYGGFWFGVQGGLRYWVSPQVAINGRVAFGTLSYGAIEVGVDFKLN